MVIPAESGTAAHVPDVTNMGQMAARVRYSEGDWFAVPLRDGGFAVGLIARANRNGVLFGYFFGPKRSALPTTRDLTGLSATGAVLVTTFGHLGVRDGKWPLIESATEWNREAWPMPTFGRFEELSGRAFAVEYRNDDPNSRPRETQIDPDDLSRYPPDGLSGAGAVEIRLTNLLA
jgi:Immunity protein 26